MKLSFLHRLAPKSVVNLIFFVSIASVCYAMDQGAVQKSFPIIPAQERQFPPILTLQQIAARSAIKNLSHLRSNIANIPQGIQDILKKEIVLEHANILETINDAQAISLSALEMHPEFVKISPDSSYVAYIAQKRFHNNRFNLPHDTLVVIHVPTGEEETVYSSELGYQWGDRGFFTSDFMFSQDSASILFKSANPQTTQLAWQYHIPSKTLSPCRLDQISPAEEENPTEIVSFDEKIKIRRDSKTVYLDDAQSGETIRAISYGNTVGDIKFVNKHSFIASVANNWDQYLFDGRTCDLLLTDCTTGDYKILARRVSLPYELSDDAAFLVGTQHVPSTDCSYIPDELFDCNKQITLRSYKGKNPRWCGHQLSPDATFVLVNGVIRTNGLDKLYPHIYYTHRALTNTASLGDIVALLLAEKNYSQREAIPDELMAQLKQSNNANIKDAVSRRYDGLWNKMLSSVDVSSCITS